MEKCEPYFWTGARRGDLTLRIGYFFCLVIVAATPAYADGLTYKKGWFLADATGVQVDAKAKTFGGEVSILAINYSGSTSVYTPDLFGIGLVGGKPSFRDDRVYYEAELLYGNRGIGSVVSLGGGPRLDRQAGTHKRSIVGRQATLSLTPSAGLPLPTFYVRVVRALAPSDETEDPVVETESPRTNDEPAQTVEIGIMLKLPVLMATATLIALAF